MKYKTFPDQKKSQMDFFLVSHEGLEKFERHPLYQVHYIELARFIFTANYPPGWILICATRITYIPIPYHFILQDWGFCLSSVSMNLTMAAGVSRNEELCTFILLDCVMNLEFDENYIPRWKKGVIQRMKKVLHPGILHEDQDEDN